MADRTGFAILACDLQGMSTIDGLTWVGTLTTEGGRFPELQELAWQGVANQLVQQRLVKTSLAEDPDPRLRRDDGALAWDPSTVWYYGNSQGGSVGTLVTATSLDVERGVLGVHCHKDRVTLGRAGDKPLRPGVACSPCRHLFGRVGAKAGYADRCKCQRRERLGIAGAERAEGIVHVHALARAPQSSGIRSLWMWTTTYFISASSTVRCACARHASTAAS
jgi:hypothetical protein